jgi:sortase A
MRSVFSWALVAGGMLLMTVGLGDVGTAWLEQRQAVASTAAAKNQIPEGFAAKLTIPRLESSVYVVEAKSKRDFRRGPGYIEGSARPGEDGNTLIAGHRDLHFRVLKNVKVGDEITIESDKGTFSYRVSSIEIVSPKRTEALRKVFPRQLTLITCYPFYYLGSAPQRLIVRAASL